MIKEKFQSFIRALKIAFRIVAVGVFLFFAYMAQLLTVTYGEWYINIHLGTAHTLHDEVNDTLRDSDKAIREADLLIEDARRRGLLE